MHAPTTRKRVRGLGPLDSRISPGEQRSAHDETQHLVEHPHGQLQRKPVPAQPENSASSVDTTSDTSSRKPNTRM